jgi:hypothetical protein
MLAEQAGRRVLLVSRREFGGDLAEISYSTADQRLAGGSTPDRANRSWGSFLALETAS